MAASLTRISIVSRKIIRYSIFLVIFLVIAKFSLDIGIGVFRYFFPKPLPPATVVFGKLPKLPFGETQVPAGLTFTLETPEGGFPKISPQAKIYLMQKLSPNLLSLDAAQVKAGRLGYDAENPQEVSQSTYRFSHKSANSTLEINIISGTFSINFDLSSDPSALQKRPPIPEIAEETIRDYLSSADLLPEDLSGRTIHEFLKPKEGKLSPVISLSDSNFVKINLFRRDYDNLPVYTENPNQANVWFIASGLTENGKQIIAGEFHYFPVDESIFATYPLKTPEAAWQELTTGGGYVSNLGTNKEGDNIKVRRVYLAYFDAKVPVEFLQPVYVFEGDRAFTAYVPAVTPDYYGE